MRRGSCGHMSERKRGSKRDSPSQSPCPENAQATLPQRPATPTAWRLRESCRTNKGFSTRIMHPNEICNPRHCLRASLPPIESASTPNPAPIPNHDRQIHRTRQVHFLRGRRVLVIHPQAVRYPLAALPLPGCRESAQSATAGALARQNALRNTPEPTGDATPNKPWGAHCFGCMRAHARSAC